MTTFGESAPASELATFFGISLDNVLNQAQALLDRFEADAHARIASLQAAVARRAG